MLAILALTSSAMATCDHPYFPAALNMSWTYSVSNLENITRVVSADARSYVTEALFDTNSFREKVQCQSDGSLIIATYFSNFELNGESSKEQVVPYSGVNIPAPHLWVVGTQWTYASAFKSVSVYETALTVETGTEKVHSKIVGSELISVPAGKFRALKVIQTTNSFRKVAQNRLSTTSKKTFTRTFWYAQGVGVVKISGEDFTSVLTDFVKP